MPRYRTVLFLISLTAQACDERSLALGSDIRWTMDAESGDLPSSTGDPATGTYTLSADAQVAVSSDRAHSGRYAIRIANVAAGTDGGGGIYREASSPEEAFYSAWYYVPRPYKTVTGWLVMRFAARLDQATVHTTIGLTLFSRPGGDLELRLNDYRPEYLQAPLADPPPIVPVGRWFHLEAFFRNSADATGRITVWLDGVRTYDYERPMGSVPILYFAVCGETNQLDPTDAELLIDDIAIADSRVTPEGVLEAPP